MPPAQRDPNVARDFGHALKVTRVRRDLTRRQVAEAAGLKPGTVARIERGERDPILSVVFRLAQALGLTPAALMQAMEEERERVPPP